MANTVLLRQTCSAQYQYARMRPTITVSACKTCRSSEWPDCVTCQCWEVHQTGAEGALAFPCSFLLSSMATMRCRTASSSSSICSARIRVSHALARIDDFCPGRNKPSSLILRMTSCHPAHLHLAFWHAPEVLAPSASTRLCCIVHAALHTQGRQACTLLCMQSPSSRICAQPLLRTSMQGHHGHECWSGCKAVFCTCRSR